MSEKDIEAAVKARLATLGEEPWRRLFDGIVPLHDKHAVTLFLGYPGLHFIVGFDSSTHPHVSVAFFSPGLAQAPSYPLAEGATLQFEWNQRRFQIHCPWRQIVGEPQTMRAHLRITEVDVEVPDDAFSHQFFDGEIVDNLSAKYPLHAAIPHLVMQALDFGNVPGVADPADGKCAHLVVDSGTSRIALVPWLQVGGSVITTSWTRDVSFKFVASRRHEVQNVLHMTVFIDRL